MTNLQLISQEFFDEMLLENQDVFDYDDDDEAVKETVKELQNQQQQRQHSSSSAAAAAAAAGGNNGGGTSPALLDKHSTTLDYLSLTHPDSEVGKHDREIQRKFIQCFGVSTSSSSSNNSISENNCTSSSSTFDLETALSVVQELSKSDKLPMAWSMIVQHQLFIISNGGSTTTAPLDVDDENDESSIRSIGGDRVPRLLIDLTLALVPSNISIQDQLCKAVKVQLASHVWFSSGSSADIVSGSIPGGAFDAAAESSRWFTCLASAATATASAEDHLLPSGSTSTTIEDPLLQQQLLLFQVGQNLCNGAEQNKKTFVATAMKFRPSTFSSSLSSCNNGLDLFVQKFLVITDDCWSSSSLDADDSAMSVAREGCQLLSVLCKFQPIAEQPVANATASPGEPPLVSSAHANVKEFQKAGALPKLYRIVDYCLTRAEEEEDGSNSRKSSRRARSLLLCDAMTALRVMAIDNDIVQNMVALGILDVVTRSLQMAVRDIDIRGDENAKANATAATAATVKQQNLAFVTSTFGLIRNLCANDEIKTTICKSSLGPILALMQHFQVPSGGQDQRQQQQQQQQLLQEHACGILAAMTLKQPQNASSICDSNSNNGHMLILDAMQLYPQSVTLQRQACLAVRNIASRIDPPMKQMILDAGAERIIQQYAGCHQGSVEEAYAALRDLGCNPKIRTLDENGNLKGTEEFGKVKSNFRAVYE